MFVHCFFVYSELVQASLNCSFAKQQPRRRLVKMVSSKAARSADPEAYWASTLRGSDELRTKLGAIFTSLLKKEIPLRHRKHRHRITCQDLPVGFHHIGLRIHVNARQRIVQLHIALADAAALLHRRHAFLQAE